MVPVLNEADHIDRCLESLAAQDYPGITEIVVADGGSTDATPVLLAAWQRRLRALQVIANPERLQSTGCNQAARHGSGEILVRADAHTSYAPDYVSRSVATLLRTGASAVGGRMQPAAETRYQRAVAAAMTSPWAIGPAKFRYVERESDTDVVYLGTFRRADFLRIGGYRTFPSGVAEDADLFFRLRAQGGRVVLDPHIRSFYSPRGSWGKLWQQFRRYGQGKAEMLWANGVFPSWRPLAPLLLVGVLAASLVVSLAGGPWWLFPAVITAWIGTLVVVALPHLGRAPLVAVVAGLMQFAYGLGLLWGLARGPGAVRELRRAEHTTPVE